MLLSQRPKRGRLVCRYRAGESYIVGNPSQLMFAPVSR